MPATAFKNVRSPFKELKFSTLEVKPIVLFAMPRIIKFSLIRSCTDTSLPVLLSYGNSLSVPPNILNEKVVQTGQKNLQTI